jgi:hypothetical protein
MGRLGTLRKEDAVIGEDAIVLKAGSDMWGGVGQICKVSDRGDRVKVSVSFDGEIYNFSLDELTLS